MLDAPNVLGITLSLKYSPSYVSNVIYRVSGAEAENFSASTVTIARFEIQNRANWSMLHRMCYCFHVVHRAHW